MPPTTTQLVTLFQDVNYSGSQWGFSRSYAYVGDAANDQASSVIVLPGYSAVFYRDANYHTELFRIPGDFGRNCASVGAANNDAISSIQIYAGDFAQLLDVTPVHLVTLFQDINYGGTFWTFDRSAATLPAAANDQASSYVVAPGYYAVFYKDANYLNPVADSEVVSPDCYWVGDAANDAISSLRIFNAQGHELNPSVSHRVTIFADQDYGGQQWGFDNSADVPAAANDQMSSGLIEPGYSAIFYADAEFTTPLFRLRYRVQVEALPQFAEYQRTADRTIPVVILSPS